MAACPARTMGDGVKLWMRVGGDGGTRLENAATPTVPPAAVVFNRAAPVAGLRAAAVAAVGQVGGAPAEQATGYGSEG